MPAVKRNSYTVKKKLEIIAQRRVSNLSGRKFAESVGVDEASIRRWMLQEGVLGTAKVSSKNRTIRKVPRKKIGYFPEIDDLIHKYVLDRNQKGLRVKDRFIQRQAIKIRDELIANAQDDAVRKRLMTFGASNIWVYRFKQRANLVARRHTTAHKLPQDFREKTAAFIQHVQGLIAAHNIIAENVINFDQVPRYFEAPKRNTITTKGSKEVLLGRCSNGHKRFTFTPFVDASGRILIRHALFSKRSTVPRHNQQVRVSVNGTGMWNMNVLKENVDEVVRLSRGIFGRDRFVLIILDSYPVHVKFVRVNEAEYLQQKVIFAVIPAGLTGILQPLDVCLNRIFQQFFDDKAGEYQAESISQDKNKTPKGNIKMPTAEVISQWLVQWSETISAEQVRKAFRVCGLSPDFSPDQLHKALKDIYNRDLTVEQWIADHGSALDAVRVVYGGEGWDVFGGKHPFCKALKSLSNTTKDDTEWAHFITGKIISILEEDELTSEMVTPEEKLAIRQGNQFTHGLFEIYAAAKLFETQFHLILLNAEDEPTERTIFGADADDEPFGFFYKAVPFTVIVPPTYDPNEYFFVEVEAIAGVVEPGVEAVEEGIEPGDGSIQEEDEVIAENEDDDSEVVIEMLDGEVLGDETTESLAGQIAETPAGPDINPEVQGPLCMIENIDEQVDVTVQPSFADLMCSNPTYFGMDKELMQSLI